MAEWDSEEAQVEAHQRLKEEYLRWPDFGQHLGDIM